jgi:hypothetical protein
MNMVSDEIPLDEAPEFFFDQQKWSEFVDCFDNRQAALQQINRTGTGNHWLLSACKCLLCALARTERHGCQG